MSLSEPSLTCLSQVEAERGGPLHELVGKLLEHGDDARLALPQALGDELNAEHGLARSGGSGHEQAVAFGDAAAHQGVELADAGGKTPPALDVVGFIIGEAEGAREGLQAARR